MSKAEILHFFISPYITFKLKFPTLQDGYQNISVAIENFILLVGENVRAAKSFPNKLRTTEKVKAKTKYSENFPSPERIAIKLFSGFALLNFVLAE